jgi:hypothetical protein
MAYTTTLTLAMALWAPPGLPLAAAAPASAPTTVAAATAPVLDQSSPKALLRSFYTSRGEVDEATLRSLLHAATPLEQQIIDSVVKVELANVRLRSAERQKFGKALAGAPVGSQALDPERVAQIDSFEEKIDGDHATVTLPKPAEGAFEFVRVDGKWKLPVAALTGRLPGGATPEALNAVAKAQVEVIDQLTADVRGGKFAGPEQVLEELTKRLADRIAAATRSSPTAAPPPTSVPVSRPARGT